MHPKFRLFALLGLISLLAGLLAGCTPKAGPIVTEPAIVTTVQPAEPALVITDALDHTVSFDKLPERIVVAGKATPLLVNTLYMFPEAATRIAVIENRTQTPDAFIPLVDPAYTSKLTLEKNAGPEAIAPTQPDVVILKSSMKKNLGDPLEAIGIKVIYLDLETPDAFYRDLQTIGALFGNPARANEITAYYQGKIDAIRAALKDLKPEDKKTMLLLQHSVTDNVAVYQVPPAGYLQTFLVETTGGIPVWKDTAVGDGWQTVTLDQIAAWNPQLIGIIDYSGGAIDTVVSDLEDPTWLQLDAVQRHQLAAFPMDYLSWDQPDPRWLLGLGWLAAIAYPNNFTTYDVQAEMLNFYKTLYGLDKSTIATEIFPLLKGSLLLE